MLKLLILVLIIVIGALLYFLFMNLYALYLKNHPPEQEEDPMEFFNTYEPKYNHQEQEGLQPMSQENHLPKCFSILGFDSLVSEQELKTRYRELAKINHPDRGGDPVKFEEISKAYSEALKIVKNL